MQQQSSEEEDRHLSNEEMEGDPPFVMIVLRQALHGLLQSPRGLVLLAVLGGTLLAMLAQSGLLVPLLLLAFVGGIVFLTRRQTLDVREQQEEISIVQKPRERVHHIWTLDEVRLLTPREFETMIGKMLEQLHYTQVEIVGGSGDLCVDIKAIGQNGEQVAVQCKRYRDKKNIGSKDMQTFIGMIYVQHRADRGMYVTTSSYTPAARKLGENNRIEVIDGEALITMMQGLDLDSVVKRGISQQW